MTTPQELLSICDPRPIMELILIENDPIKRAVLKGTYLANTMYTQDINWYLQKQSVDGLKQSLLSKDLEMDTIFVELIKTYDPLLEATLIEQINHGKRIREKLISML